MAEIPLTRKPVVNWREPYSRRIISPEQAARMVKDGDHLVFTIGREAFSCGLAIAARKNELRNVKILAITPTFDFGWSDAGWEDSFKIAVSIPTGVCQEAVDAHRCDMLIYPPRERVSELISIAHPDFRKELRKEAESLF